jgi:hypothetical protein
VSAARVLDDIARALAEPMPRRRALRLLGASITGLTVRQLRPASARAVPGRRSVRCGEDQRTCQKGAEADYEEYCCPRPSWQFFCGGRDNGYRCINTCAAGTKFPCTALIPHPQSGINGVCCDRKYHKGCQPVGRAATCCYGSPIKCVPMGEAQCLRKGGNATWAPSERWKPQCVPCMGVSCGPKPGSGKDDPLRFVCCEKPNTCRQGTCRCPDGSPPCPGGGCCKAPTTCRRCYQGDPTTSEKPLATGKCCRKGEHCCGRRCCPKDSDCCDGKCCPKDTSCTLTSKGRNVCCPDTRAGIAGDTRFCCPTGTFPQQRGGCCPPGLESCCAGTDCERRGQFCVNGQCVP